MTYASAHGRRRRDSTVGAGGVLKLKPNKALYENSSLSYGTSPAVWDHTVLPDADTSERAPP